MIFFQFLGTILLVAALLLTVMLGLSTNFFTARPPSGPDAMGLAGLLIGMGLRWLAIFVAALICLGRGSFDWISPRPGVPTLWVIGGMIGLGVVFALCWMQWASSPKFYTVPAGLLGGMGLPILLQLYLFAVLWAPRTSVQSATWPKYLGLPLAGAGAIGVAIGTIMLVGHQVASIRRQQQAFKDHVSWEERNRREMQELEAQQAAELDALPDTEPFETFMRHLFLQYSEAHHRRALERIARLPDLTGQIDRAMSHPDPLEREYAAHYIRRCRNPDPAWAAFLHRSMAQLAHDVRAAPALYDPPTQRTYKGMIWGSLLTARCYPNENFDAEARAIRAAVAEKPDGPAREGALDLIDRYLAGQNIDEE